MSFSSLRNKITSTHTRGGQGRNTESRHTNAYTTNGYYHCPCPTMYGNMSFGSPSSSCIYVNWRFCFPWKRMTVNSMSMTPYGIGYKINVFRSKSNKKTQIFNFFVKNIR